MRLFNEFEIVDLALRYKDWLIIGDVQLGYEEALAKQGVVVPRFQINDVLQRLKKILENKDAMGITTVVVNGDLKHEFGTITNQEWRDALRLFDFLSERKLKIIVVKGNHDMVLDPIAKKREVEVVEYLQRDDVLIHHGHKLLPINDSYIVIGHEHPAISFRERKDEKFKCFLVGKWKNSNLIVMPSFNLLVAGTDITKEQVLSPYLKEGVENFEIYVIEDSVYKFGKVKEIEK